MTLLRRFAFGRKSTEIAPADNTIEVRTVQSCHRTISIIIIFATITNAHCPILHVGRLVAERNRARTYGPSRCRATGMSRAHNLGPEQYGASRLAGSRLPTLAGSRLRVAAEGSRVDAGRVCGMTLVVTVCEVAGRYLAGGWWIRCESGMERRAHRLAAIVKGLSTLPRSSSCMCYHISPGDSADARRVSAEA